MIRQTIFCLVVLSVFSMIQSVHAQVPQLINYQGQLKQNGQPASGELSITFSIYSVETGGNPLWTETQTDVPVTNGVFNVLLGSEDAFPDDLFTKPGRELYLAVKVGNDAEMTPRFRFTSVAYSLNSASVSDNSISTSKIQANAVTESKISPNIVSSIDGVSNDGGNIDLVAGSNVTITPDDVNNTITISADTSGDGVDNLGDHTAIENINLNGHWLSGDGGDEGVFVNNAGNVGIGTTTPDQELTVAGTIESTSGGFKFPDGTTQSTAVSGSSELTLPYSGTYSGDSSAFEINYNGNGGSGMNIHSSSPGAALSATNALDQGGPAANFQITNSNSSGDVITVKNLGLGLGAYFENSNLANQASVIQVRTSGFGRAGNFIINNLNNSSDAIKAETIGTGRAALFVGDVQINGDQSVSGSKNFVIDHPLDPENKILRHSSVESPERINIYKGRDNLISGVAVIQLPHYFDALNSPEGREVHLTPVNGWSPLYLDGEIEKNQFVVKTTEDGNPEQEFSWVVYGVRNDKYARENPIVVEEEKGVNNSFEKGELLYSSNKDNK